jgi:hypothetical protein
MTETMHSIHERYKGLALLVDLNSDRILFPVAIGLALMLSAYLATVSAF